MASLTGDETIVSNDPKTLDTFKFQVEPDHVSWHRSVEGAMSRSLSLQPKATDSLIRNYCFLRLCFPWSQVTDLLLYSNWEWELGE